MKINVKNSQLFWNFLVLLGEALIGLIFFYDNIKAYISVILIINSVILFAAMDEFEDDGIKPYFAFASFLGILFLIVISIVYSLFKIFTSNFIKNTHSYVFDKIQNFNDWLDNKNL